LTYGFQENKQKMILILSQTISKSLTTSTKHITNSKPIAVLGDEEVESQKKKKKKKMCGCAFTVLVWLWGKPACNCFGFVCNLL
jgi:hypothetical protein